MQIKIAIVVAAVLVGVVIWRVRTGTSTGEQQPNMATATESAAQRSAASQDMATRDGAYVPYTESAFAVTMGERLLFFHAPWCPQCRSLDSDITSAAIPEGITIFKVDYDTNQTLRVKYGVVLQTTIVRVAADGSKQKAHVAYDTPTWNAVYTALFAQ